MDIDRKIKVFSSAVVLALTAGACGGVNASTPTETSTPTKPIITGTPTPDFVVTNQSGTIQALEVSNAELLTKVAQIPSAQIPSAVPILAISPSLEPSNTPTEAPTQVLNNNWDAGDTLIQGINKDGFMTWYQTEKAKNLSKGVDRTFDRANELLADGNGDVFAKPDGTFPQAREVLANATGIGRTALTLLGFTGIDDGEANAFGLDIITGTFNVSADGKTISTRGTFPHDAANVLRVNQSEGKVCEVYEDQTKIGQEHFVGSILHLSDKAPLAFVFHKGKANALISDPDINNMSVKDENGDLLTLSWFVVDTGSQTGKPAGFDTPSDYQQFAWGADALKPCGILQSKPSVPTAVPGQPGGPTPLNHPTPEVPTDVPTNPGRMDLPTVTPGFAPTHIPPTIQSTDIPIS